ncbi:hypothetical protein C8N36_107152 [Pelagimonas varians]|uniref:Uncharacterized protein n=1 Tax=Pelagimonas varians TaxID=696760 RepID=A0A238KDN4_9RHOB|nr:hypothetical protein C8N36_107152 [Pelagimonas varians]SMX40564.1 hypothetical protein PEV8663_02043 [Pelagimonas varians]
MTDDVLIRSLQEVLEAETLEQRFELLRRLEETDVPTALAFAILPEALDLWSRSFHQKRRE